MITLQMRIGYRIEQIEYMKYNKYVKHRPKLLLILF